MGYGRLIGSLAGKQFLDDAEYQNLYITVTMGGFSAPKRYYKHESAPGHYVGFWTLVVSMDTGVITGINTVNVVN